MVFVRMGLLRFVHSLVLYEARGRYGDDDRFKDIVKKLNEEYQRGRLNVAMNNAHSFHFSS